MARRFGSVRQLASGRHQATYENQHAGGRQVAKTFTTRTEAEDWLHAERSRLQAGDWLDVRGERLRLSDYFQQWLPSKQLAPRTVELYASLWRLHLEPSLGSRRLGELNPTLVRSWHAGLVAGGHPGATTIAKSYRLLSNITNDAVRDGLIMRSPCMIRGAGSERAPEMQIATPAQIGVIAGAIEPHYRAMVLVAAWGGLRWGELAGLPLCAVDLEAGCVSVTQALIEVGGSTRLGPPKTAAASRRVYLPRSVVEVLSEHILSRQLSQPEALLFTTPSGRPLRRSNFVAVWRRATTAAGVAGLRFHDLRHTAATLATTHGATLREVQSRLGHSTPHAALRYQHALDHRDRSIASTLEASVEVPCPTPTRAVPRLGLGCEARPCGDDEL